MRIDYLSRKSSKHSEIKNIIFIKITNPPRRNDLKTLLNSLLSCSLAVVLLGFSGCQDTKKKPTTASEKKVVAKKNTKKTAHSKKNETKVAALYNNLDQSFSETNFRDEADKLSFIDDQPVEIFDPNPFDTTEEAEKISALSIADQQALEEEVNSLVALWQSEDAGNGQVSVDFKSLFLDEETQKPSAQEPVHVDQKVAHNEDEETARSIETNELRSIEQIANLEQEEIEEIEGELRSASTNLMA